MTRMKFAALFLVAALLEAVAFAQNVAQPAAPKPVATVKRARVQSPGERAFQNNCNRCHYAPEELNARLTGTAVRHMRVRANLSAEDERLIMTYLAP